MPLQERWLHVATKDSWKIAMNLREVGAGNHSMNAIKIEVGGHSLGGFWELEMKLMTKQQLLHGLASAADSNVTDVLDAAEDLWRR